MKTTGPREREEPPSFPGTAPLAKHDTPRWNSTCHPEGRHNPTIDQHKGCGRVGSNFLPGYGLLIRSGSRGRETQLEARSGREQVAGLDRTADSRGQLVHHVEPQAVAVGFARRKARVPQALQV